MTGSAVLDTVLGMVFLFYALALVCGGLVEMIANWVKKRAKYLLRGIRDLLEEREDAVAGKTAWDRMQDTIQNAYRDGKEERERYNETLQVTRPTPPPQGSIHREKITVEDVMGHALVQPFKHSASLGRPTRNPAYLPSNVFARALIDLLTPGDSMDPTLADIEVGIRELNASPNLRWSLASILKSARGRRRVLHRRPAGMVRPSDGSSQWLIQALGEALCHRYLS
jgi:hypothetical protein